MKKSCIPTLLRFVFLFTFLILSACSDSGCLGAEEKESYQTYVDSNPVLDFKLSYGSCYPARRTCTSPRFHNSSYKANGTNITMRVYGAWTGWQYTQKGVMCDRDKAIRSASDNYVLGMRNMEERLNNMSGLSDAERPYRVALGHFLDENEELFEEVSRQKPCWYSGGDGLYLGFLDGYSGGREITEMYHLQSDSIECPDEYRNGADWYNKPLGPCKDCACVSKTCPTDLRDKSGFDFGNCKYYDGDEEFWSYEDKGYAQFSLTDYLEELGKSKNQFLSDIQNKYIAFKILDKYHYDNRGGYTIEITSGVGVLEGGIISSIVDVVEEYVLGEEQRTGVREGGFVQLFYRSILLNQGFQNIVRGMLTLYVVLLGFGVLTGRADLSSHSLMRRLITVSIIIFFTSNTGWEVFEQYIINFFLGVAKLNLLNYVGPAYVGDALVQLDNLLMDFFGSRNLHIKIWSMVFSYLFFVGIIVVMMFYAFLAYFAYIVFKAVYMYLNSFLQLVLAFALFPFVVVMYLFEFTKEIFLKWFSIATSKAVEMNLVILITTIFVAIISDRFTSIMSLYKVCFQKISFGFFTLMSVPFPEGGDFSMLMGVASLIITSAMLVYILHKLLDVVIGLANKLGDIQGAGLAPISTSGKNSLMSLMKGFGGGVRRVGKPLGLNYVANKAYRGAGQLYGKTVQFSGKSAMFLGRQVLKGATYTGQGISKTSREVSAAEKGVGKLISKSAYRIPIISRIPLVKHAVALPIWIAGSTIQGAGKLTGGISNLADTSFGASRYAGHELRMTMQERRDMALANDIGNLLDGEKRKLANQGHDIEEVLSTNLRDQYYDVAIERARRKYGSAEGRIDKMFDKMFDTSIEQEMRGVVSGAGAKIDLMSNQVINFVEKTGLGLGKHGYAYNVSELQEYLADKGGLMNVIEGVSGNADVKHTIRKNLVDRVGQIQDSAERLRLERAYGVLAKAKTATDDKEDAGSDSLSKKLTPFQRELRQKMSEKDLLAKSERHIVKPKKSELEKMTPEERAKYDEDLAKYRQEQKEIVERKKKEAVIAREAAEIARQKEIQKEEKEFLDTMSKEADTLEGERGTSYKEFKRELAEAVEDREAVREDEIMDGFVTAAEESQEIEGAPRLGEFVTPAGISEEDISEAITEEITDRGEFVTATPSSEVGDFVTAADTVETEFATATEDNAIKRLLSTEEASPELQSVLGRVESKLEKIRQVEEAVENLGADVNLEDDAPLTEERVETLKIEVEALKGQAQETYFGQAESAEDVADVGFVGGDAVSQVAAGQDVFEIMKSDANKLMTEVELMKGVSLGSDEKAEVASDAEEARKAAQEKLEKAQEKIRKLEEKIAASEALNAEADEFSTPE